MLAIHVTRAVANKPTDNHGLACMPCWRGISKGQVDLPCWRGIWFSQNNKSERKQSKANKKQSRSSTVGYPERQNNRAMSDVGVGRAVACLLKERGQRDEKGFEETTTRCCRSSRPTTSQTQLDSQPETVQRAQKERCGVSCL